MPTGYTAMIEDGSTNARLYVERCSKAFGLFVHMRDEDMDKPMTYPEPSSYAFDALTKERDKLRFAKNWDKEFIAAKHEQYVRKEEARQAEAKEEHDRIRANYKAVLDKLKLWEPEDEVSQNIKRFAIEQIELCHKDEDYKPYTDIERNADVWYNTHISGLERSVKWYLEDIEKETERNMERINSINKFRQELSKVPS